MGLEFGQIITQIVGFLIAILLLKKFAWKPLLSMLEERRTKIKAEFDAIDQEKKKTEDLQSDYRKKLQEIDAFARVKIQEAAREGQKLADEIKEEARQEARDIVYKTREDVERDIEKAKVQLRDEVIGMTLQITEKFIGEKLDAEKDKKLVTRLVDDMQQGKVEGLK
jgi:F-type H+-transporting ATPase subunit b